MAVESAQPGVTRSPLQPRTVRSVVTGFRAQQHRPPARDGGAQRTAIEGRAVARDQHGISAQLSQSLCQASGTRPLRTVRALLARAQELSMVTRGQVTLPGKHL